MVLDAESNQKGWSSPLCHNQAVVRWGWSNSGVRYRGTWGNRWLAMLHLQMSGACRIRWLLSRQLKSDNCTNWHVACKWSFCELTVTWRTHGFSVGEVVERLWGTYNLVCLLEAGTCTVGYVPGEPQLSPPCFTPSTSWARQELQVQLHRCQVHCATTWLGAGLEKSLFHFPYQLAMRGRVKGLLFTDSSLFGALSWASVLVASWDI